VDDHTTELIRISSEDQLAHFLDNGLRDLYHICFGEAPWFEKFEDFEVDEIIREGFSYPESQLYVVLSKGCVVAFGIAYPLKNSPEVVQFLGDLVNPETTMYMADVAVLPEYRGRGLGTLLVDTRLTNLPLWCKGVLMRTAQEGSKSMPIYLRKNFRLFEGKVQMVNSRKADGSFRPDPRVFLYCEVENIRKEKN